jgi:hypothetical protein
VAVAFVTCPICGTEQPAVSKYPDYLCRSCVSRASTAEGRRLVLVNTSLTGGFAARYADTEELCEEVTITHVVYVDGVRCWADEASLGGIVVQPRPEAERRGGSAHDGK